VRTFTTTLHTKLSKAS